MYEPDPAATTLGGRYLIVLANYDSEDWRRPGVAGIVRRASPPGTVGGIVMLHGGGGNRQETVTALERLIPALRTRGFRFVTVSELAGLPKSFVEPSTPAWERRRGLVFGAAVRFGFALVRALLLAVGLVGVLFAARVVLVFTLASYQLRSTRRRQATAAHLPPVAVVIPAYNEAVGIERAVRSLAASDYPDFEVVVVRPRLAAVTVAGVAQEPNRDSGAPARAGRRGATSLEFAQPTGCRARVDRVSAPCGARPNRARRAGARARADAARGR